MYDIVLSIKPIFAELIYSKQKIYELRKSAPKKSIKYVYLYESGNVKRVTGRFELKEIIKLNLDDLWSKTKDSIGISKKEFDEYFLGKTFGYAYVVENPVKLKISRGIELFGMLKPPESFAYIKENKPTKFYKYCNLGSGYKVLKNRSLLLNKPTNYNDPFDSKVYYRNDDFEKYYNDDSERQMMRNIFNVVDPQIDNYNSETKKEILKLESQFNKYEQDRFKGLAFKAPSFIHKFIVKQRKTNFLNIDSFLTEEHFPYKQEDYIKDKLNNLMQNYYCTCVSTINDSILMWSHYANNHTGICIEFDYDERFQQVYYSKERKILDIYKYLCIDETSKFTHPFQFKALHEFYEELSEILLTKSSDWEYENEYRCIVNSTKVANTDDISFYKNDYYLNLKNITCVYFGAKTNLQSKDALKILNYCKKHKIPVKYFECDDENFELKIRK